MNSYFTNFKMSTFKANLYLNIKYVFSYASIMSALIIMISYFIILANIGTIFDVIDAGVEGLDKEYFTTYLPKSIFMVISLCTLFIPSVISCMVVILQKKSGMQNRIHFTEINWQTHILQTIISLSIISYFMITTIMLVDYTLLQILFGFKISIDALWGIIALLIPILIATVFLTTVSIGLTELLRGSWFSLAIIFTLIFVESLLSSTYFSNDYSVGSNWMFWETTQNTSMLLLLDSFYLSAFPIPLISMILNAAYNFNQINSFYYIYFIVYSTVMTLLILVALLRFGNFRC